MANYNERKLRRQNLINKKHKRRRIIKRIIITILLLGLLAVIAAAAYAVYVVKTSAENIDTADIYSQVNQRSTLYNDDGKEIENVYFGDGNRTIIAYSDLPKDMVNAIVSIEDAKFWDHHGFNFIRMVGAIKDRIIHGGQISGTSTITQQLARNIYLSDTKSERSLKRKILEGWYTIKIEESMSKEQIMEAYLNTVYFGFNCYGIEAASKTYFGIDTSKLTTEECANLAALPQSPDVYALVKYNESGDIEYNGAASQERKNLVAKQMKANGYIDAATCDEIVNGTIEDNLNVKEQATSDYGYYTDYVIDMVTKDLQEQLDISEEDASRMIYTKGLKIYTCLDTKVQKVLHDEINDSDNYTTISYIPTDNAGNLINNKDGSILARPYSSYLNSKGTFTLKKSEYSQSDDGTITIYKGKRLALYEATTSTGSVGVNISFRTLFERDGNSISLIEGGSLQIPSDFVSFDSDNNAVVSKSFIEANPEFFVKDGDNLKISKENYTLGQKTPQPQAAAAIIDNETRQLKAMVGGRGTTGKQLYNRAINPRQPGSSIKPIAVYGPALQLSYEALQKGNELPADLNHDYFGGGYIMPATIFQDTQTIVGGKVWPQNSYRGYTGSMTVRRALQQSCNVVAYKIFCQVGVDNSIKMLEKNGITTIDKEGDVNDLNAAALALGGLSNGITPLEMTTAYSTFPNGGVYQKAYPYTKVVDAKGETILESQSCEDYQKTQAYNEGVAFIMTDIMQTVVTRGIAGNAAIGNVPVGGKTGTTSDQYDIWFSGFSPQYSMALWEGCDVNLQLTSSSSAAASFWSSIMKRINTDSSKRFRSKPSNVLKTRGEYFIQGTENQQDTQETTTTTETTQIEIEMTTTDPYSNDENYDENNNYNNYYTYNNGDN